MKTKAAARNFTVNEGSSRDVIIYGVNELLNEKLLNEFF